MSQKIQAELDAILHGAAFASLDDRAFLRVTGSDATRWLNGMVTNSIQALGPGEGCYNFLLNAQGRILGDCTVYRDQNPGEGSYFLVTDKEQVETIQKHLEHFIIMDDVELKDIEYYDQPLLILGPEAPVTLRAIEHPTLEYTGTHSGLQPLHLASYQLTSNLIYTPTRGMVPRFEVSSESRDILMGEAVKAGAAQVSSNALEALRQLEARPLYGRDITEKYLPQETNQPQALHFNKGCYLGQEIVERIRSRGQVHRLLTPLTLTGKLPSEFPAPMEADGKPAGEITSAALVPLPEGDQILALGYVRREALDTHASLTYAGGTAAPRSAAQVQTGAGASK